MFNLSKNKSVVLTLSLVCSLMMVSCGKESSLTSSSLSSSTISSDDSSSEYSSVSIDYQQKADELPSVITDSNRQGGFYSLFGYSFKDGNSSKYLSVDSSMNLVEDSTGWAFTGFTYGPDGDFGLECYSPDSPLDAHYVCLDSDSGLLFASSDKSKAALFKGADFSGEFSLEAFSSSSDWVGETKKIGMSSSGKISSSQTPIVWECSLYNSAIGKEYQGKEAKEDWPICPSLGNLMDDVIVNGVTTHKENDPIYECKTFGDDKTMRMTIQKQDSPQYYGYNDHLNVISGTYKDIFAPWESGICLMDVLMGTYKNKVNNHLPSALLNTDYDDYNNSVNFFNIDKASYNTVYKLKLGACIPISQQTVYIWEEVVFEFKPIFVREFSQVDGKKVCAKEFIIFQDASTTDDYVYGQYPTSTLVYNDKKLFYYYNDNVGRTTDLD